MNGGLRVVKMSGAGNDFVILGPQALSLLEGDPAPWVRRVCRRGLSVGADGVLIVEPAGTDRVRVRFLNPDGSLAFCGNGSRCAARFARLCGMAGDRMVMETLIGEVSAEVLDDRVRLVLPPPVDLGMRPLELEGERLEGRAVDAGVPHYVVFVGSPDDAPLERWGPAVRRHPRFGERGTNFDVVGTDPDLGLVLRTWERGVEAETLACGSGAVAAAFAARLEGCEAKVRVVPTSGIPLEVELPGPRRSPSAAILTGDARVVFVGELGPEATSGVPVE